MVGIGAEAGIWILLVTSDRFRLSGRKTQLEPPWLYQPHQLLTIKWMRRGGSEEGPATSEYNIKTGLVSMAARAHRGSAWRLLNGDLQTLL